MDFNAKHAAELMTAIKNLSNDLERRTKILADLLEGNTKDHKEELALRDLAIDDLIAHKRQATIVIELFRTFHKTAKKLREDREDPRDRDLAMSDLEWLVEFIREDNNHNRAEADRLASLERRVTSLEEQNKSKQST